MLVQVTTHRNHIGNELIDFGLQILDHSSSFYRDYESKKWIAVSQPAFYHIQCEALVWSSENAHYQSVTRESFFRAVARRVAHALCYR
ncbi:hypothetical protein KTH_25790 [Thermosporothrix hazakensis]|nr:hypothetical protein KTH_25790 [Thermosporothrix hazakensis]